MTTTKISCRILPPRLHTLWCATVHNAPKSAFLLEVVHEQALIKSEHQLHKKHQRKHTCRFWVINGHIHLDTIPNDYESWNITMLHKNIHTRSPGTNHALKRSNIVNIYNMYSLANSKKHICISRKPNGNPNKNPDQKDKRRKNPSRLHE